MKEPISSPRSIFLFAIGITVGTGFTVSSYGIEGGPSRTRLTSTTPDDEILRLDADGDGRFDVIERWWNGHRVRWLDENGDMQAGDTRGDQLADVLQIDVGGDGGYDGSRDINIKWADLDSDGIPDMQAFVLNPRSEGWDKGSRGRRRSPWGTGEWMIFRNSDQRGVLGWMDWSQFKFDCWGHTGTSNWLPNYHGDTVFLKIHAPVETLEDATLNWENPFVFFDYDDDGVCETAMRWIDDPIRKPNSMELTGRLTEAFVTYDLDNDSGKDNESDFDLSLRSSGGSGIDYREMVERVPGFLGNPKFDAYFVDNVWRRLDTLRYMPPEQSYDAFFDADWGQTYLVFDEDDDDHRWERVEVYYPEFERFRKTVEADTHSTTRSREEDKTPGLSGHAQADSLGDRGEFDADNSGRAKLYLGVFDRKLHLYGAEWGAWLVDREGAFHGGRLAPSLTPDAPEVAEVVKYTDTDANGFFDTIEFDYDGDRTVDLRVSLLALAGSEVEGVDRSELIDPRELGWEGLHDYFNRMAQDAWVEALQVYRAAWRRGLTTPELDKLAHASSMAQRYQDAYWIKEEIFRLIRKELVERRATDEAQTVQIDAQLEALTRAYYLGRFDEYAELIGKIAGH